VGFARNLREEIAELCEGITKMKYSSLDVPPVIQRLDGSADETRASLHRRKFLRIGMLGAAAAAVATSSSFASWMARAQSSTPDLIADTYNGLLAFIVPGPDSYSVEQSVSPSEPGGLAAGVADLLIVTVDESVPYAPPFSAVVAALLNQLAEAVHPNGSGNFPAPFSNLLYPEKVAVLQIMDRTDALKPLSGILPAIVAFLCFSDAGTFDRATRTITAQPVGWDISNYSGVADGRAEFRGYFRNRQSASDSNAQGEN